MLKDEKLIKDLIALGYELFYSEPMPLDESFAIDSRLEALVFANMLYVVQYKYEVLEETARKDEIIEAYLQTPWFLERFNPAKKSKEAFFKTCDKYSDLAAKDEDINALNRRVVVTALIPFILERTHRFI